MAKEAWQPLANIPQQKSLNICFQNHKQTKTWEMSGGIMEIICLCRHSKQSTISTAEYVRNLITTKSLQDTNMVSALGQRSRAHTIIPSQSSCAYQKAVVHSKTPEPQFSSVKEIDQNSSVKCLYNVRHNI